MSDETHRAFGVRGCRCFRGLLLATPGSAVAEPGSPDSIAGRSSPNVANVNQKLQDLGAAIQAQQEGVNKAIVDVQTARDNADTAQREVDGQRSARRGGQHRDRGGAAALRHVRRRDVHQRAVESVPDGHDPADIIDTAATADQTLSRQLATGHLPIFSGPAPSR